MHAVIRQYTGASPLIDALDRKRDEVETIFRGIPGFVGYHAIRADDRLITVTVCADRPGAEESSRRAAQWVRKNVPDAKVSAPQVSEGEVFIDFTATASTPSLPFGAGAPASRAGA